MCLVASSAPVAVKHRVMDQVYTVKIFPVFIIPKIWFIQIQKGKVSRNMKEKRC
jgi:hypothetical protein